MNSDETPSVEANEAKSPAARISNRLPPRARARRRPLFWALAAVACVAAGIVIGAGSSFLYFSRGGGPTRPNSGELVDRIIERLDKTVSLTGSEKTRCHDIVSRHMDEVNRIRRESFSDIRSQFDGMRDDISVVIGSQRAEKWDEEIRRSWPRREQDGEGERDGGSRHGNRHGNRR